MLSNNFEITRGAEVAIQGILPNAAYPVGTAFKVASVDADTGERTFALASGVADGFVMRDVRVPSDGINGNPRTDTEILYNQGLEVAFTGGRHGTLEWGEEVEVEGTDLILTSGTGAITTGTAVGTKLSFLNGKFRVAQSAEYAQFRLVAQMTPITVGQVRIKASEIEGYLVP